VLASNCSQNHQHLAQETTCGWLWVAVDERGLVEPSWDDVDSRPLAHCSPLLDRRCSCLHQLRARSNKTKSALLGLIYFGRSSRTWWKGTRMQGWPWNGWVGWMMQSSCTL
jgi:hypothetical protein